MQNGNPQLIESIRDTIRARGPQSFAWFMEQALYHPEFGYYASNRCEIGRKGDYFTNVSVGPLFGRLLARQFIEIWTKLGKVDNFRIIEQGAHHGEFASDVLESVRQTSPDFFSALRYFVVEPFAALQNQQRQNLSQFRDKIEWTDSIDRLEPFVGIHFCNELLDAFPVHLIASTGDGWQERFVSIEDDRFIFIEKPIAESKLRAGVEQLPPQPAGYVTEINLAALDWVDDLAAKLDHGYLLIVDYGYSREEFYSIDRSNGTLQSRAQHRTLNSPFDSVGHSDMTAHLDWTSLAERAEAKGLSIAGLTDQHRFLTGIISESPELSDDLDAKAKRALQTLIHPEMLGRKFQVLALVRNVDANTRLSGFKFARDARVALGL